VSDLEELFKDLEQCCLHEPVWHPADVDRELAWYGDRSTGSESSSIVIVRLKSSKPGAPEYGLLTQSEDYTGHGCQCDSMTVKEASLAKLLAHLDDLELLDVLAGGKS
jgi:hypothetical protein